MILSQEAVSSFQILYQKKCGEEIEFEQARVMATKELRRFALIYRPVRIENKDFFSNLVNENGED